MAASSCFTAGGSGQWNHGWHPWIWRTPTPRTPRTGWRAYPLSFEVETLSCLNIWNAQSWGGSGAAESKGDAASVPGWRLKVESPVDETLPYSAKSVQTTVTARRHHFFFVASLGRNWAISHALHIFMKKWIVSSLIKEEDVTKIGEQKSKTTTALMNLNTSPAELQCSESD